MARHGTSLSLMEALHHPEGRVKEHDIKSDKPGRSFDSHGHGRHALESHDGPHSHEMGNFVRSIAHRLDQGRQRNEFTELVLIAEPHLMGLLRDALDKNTARLVIRSLSKDLQNVAIHDLWPHLRDHLPPA